MFLYCDIFLLYLYRKTEKTEKKFGHFAECISQNTRQCDHTGHARKHLCRVLMPWHSTKFWTLPCARGWALGKVLNFAECRPSGTRQSFELCPVPTVRHSTNVPSPTAPHGKFAECGWLSATSLPSAREVALDKNHFAVRGFAECSLPSVDTKINTLESEDTVRQASEYRPSVPVSLTIQLTRWRWFFLSQRRSADQADFTLASVPMMCSRIKYDK